MRLEKQVRGTEMSATASRILEIDAELAALDHSSAKTKYLAISIILLVLCLLAIVVHVIAPNLVEYTYLAFVAALFGMSSKTFDRMLNPNESQQLERELGELIANAPTRSLQDNHRS